MSVIDTLFCLYQIGVLDYNVREGGELYGSRFIYLYR